MAGRAAPGIRQFFPPPFGPIARMKRDPLGFLLDCRHRFGDVCRLRVGPFAVHLLAHPDHIKYVLLDNQKNYPRSWVYDRTKVAAGEGLVTTEGPAWRRLRRMSQPAFHHRRIAAMAAAMTDATGAMCRRWREHARSGEPIDVAAEFMVLTLRIVGRTLLSIDLGGEADRIGPAIATMLEYVQHRLDNILAPPPSIPTPKNLRFRRALRELDGVISGIIDQRRRDPAGAEADDLLAMLMAARDEETGEGLADRELRDQILTFITAGHETTAGALAWTTHLLAQHPEAGRLRHDG